MIKFAEKHPVFAIICISLVMLLPNLDSLVVTIMEARNFITAREMVNDGNWLLTTMNGLPRYEKPPLPTWLTAFSGMLFGMKSLFALRLPAAIMVAFSGVFLFKFSKKLTKDSNLSLIIGLIFITSFYTIAIINEAPWDIFTHGFMIAGIYFLFLLFESSKKKYKNALIASVFIGFSLMSKGPVSFYALFLPFIISYGIVFKFKNFKTKLLPFAICIILFLVIGGWWFLYIRIVDSEAFITIAQKETVSWNTYNVKPLYYYWNFFTQSGIWTIFALIGLIYPYMIKRVSNTKLYKFSFFWTIFAVLLLSLIPEKKSRYLLPVLYPLAINTGFYLEYIIRNFNKTKFKRNIYLVYFNFVLIGLIALIIPIISYTILENKFEGLLLNFSILSIVLFSIGIFIFKSLKNKKIKNAFYAKVTLMASILLFGLPLQKVLYQNPDFNNIKNLKNSIEINEQIKSYSFESLPKFHTSNNNISGSLTPELLWHYGGKITNIKEGDSINFPRASKFGLLIPEKHIEVLDNLPKEYNFELIDEFDLNYFKKKRKRLIRKYYLITKK